MGRHRAPCPMPASQAPSEARVEPTRSRGGIPVSSLHIDVVPRRGRLMTALTAALTTAPSAHAVGEQLSHVASASTAGNRSNHTVRIPASVQPRDGLVLFLTWNSTTAVSTPPASWTHIENRSGDGIGGRAWTKAATSADTNANVTVTTSTAAKSVIAASAYRSTGGVAEVTASEIGGANAPATRALTRLRDGRHLHRDRRGRLGEVVNDDPHGHGGAMTQACPRGISIPGTSVTKGWLGHG